MHGEKGYSLRNRKPINIKLPLLDTFHVENVKKYLENFVEKDKRMRSQNTDRHPTISLMSFHPQWHNLKSLSSAVSASVPSYALKHPKRISFMGICLLAWYCFCCFLHPSICSCIVYIFSFLVDVVGVDVEDQNLMNCALICYALLFEEVIFLLTYALLTIQIRIYGFQFYILGFWFCYMVFSQRFFRFTKGGRHSSFLILMEI